MFVQSKVSSAAKMLAARSMNRFLFPSVVFFVEDICLSAGRVCRVTKGEDLIIVRLGFSDHTLGSGVFEAK